MELVPVVLDIVTLTKSLVKDLLSLTVLTKLIVVPVIFLHKNYEKLSSHIICKSLSHLFGKNGIVFAYSAFEILMSH